MKENSLINYHILELKVLENFSERTKNICLDNQLETLFKLISYYFEYGTFIDLRNCGVKSNTELITMVKKYVDKHKVIPEMLEHEGHHRTFEEYKVYCYEQFGLKSEDAEKFRHSFVEGRFPLFEFILMILQKLLSAREFFLLEYNFGYFKSRKKLTLQAAGDIYGITRERIRQITHEIPYKIREILSAFSVELNFIKEYLQYDLKYVNDAILIDQETTDQINSLDEVNCTPRFIAIGFSMLFQDEYYFFQEERHNYKNYYLVKRDLAAIFDFSEYYHMLSVEDSVRKKTPKPVEFSKFLHRCYRKPEYESNHRIEKLCQFIANLEFGCELTPAGELVFRRNTIIRISERIVDILRAHGKPMQLKDIFAKLKEQSPKVPPSIESLRSSVLISDEIAALGKTSTYSLREWKNVKTGTIKEIAKEHLEKFERPLHISELAKYIKQYRKTLEKNIYANIKLDKTGTFVFFKGGYIGLASKKYPFPTT